jgi:ubiquinone/menaquinone biosynthesis C-methylase UbiE
MSRRLSQQIKLQIIDDYYKNSFQCAYFGIGVQGKGVAYFEKQVEKFWVKKAPHDVLEIGGGSGEHLQFLKHIPVNSYYSLDLRPNLTPKHLNEISVNLRSKLHFIQGDAESLPFEDAKFDRVLSTCLLHHVDDVLSVLLETRRVTSRGGEIAFIFPTDPGLLNQLVKKVFTYRKLRKLIKTRPEFLYSLEHKNHTLGIMEQIRFVFESDNLVFHYRPFRFLHSWNFNLCIVAKIIKK